MAMDWQHVDSIDKIQPRFLRDFPEFQIVSELSPLTSEAVFDRITMSAFEGTPLNMVLRDRGIHAFVIAGVATEVGIEPTVRHAADLGYIPVIATDACGAGDEAAAAWMEAGLGFAYASPEYPASSTCFAPTRCTASLTRGSSPSPPSLK